MFYFYSRISTAQQNSSRQLENFKSHVGYDVKKVFIEKIQGNVPFFERPEANKMFDEITDDSQRCTVVVDSIDRLGRNLLDILHTIETFTKNGINLKSLKEGFTTLLDNGDENPMAKLVISVMASIGEMERNRIKTRTAEGIAIGKAMGKFTGRKLGTIQSDEKLLQRHQTIQKKLQKGLTVREINEITGASSATIIKVKKVMSNRKMI
ncbi:Site-specific DNA recombinase [Flavobacterium gillisiae]|jgi:DNA invertase Pin-like site-specific DNA recombinase|uniref:Site-specific DNA recombinase n=1 Tax=Flavobacterium gillisiae TaxID=150146 RepID=A0A1H4C6C4_9FLAO|nr:recombinase family protein [Flavobacterium gillisiae]SEA55995.1 Site-specific DNA recombinase [Flavobacterium gillisiae]